MGCQIGRIFAISIFLLWAFYEKHIYKKPIFVALFFKEKVTLKIRVGLNNEQFSGGHFTKITSHLENWPNVGVFYICSGSEKFAEARFQSPEDAARRN
jgi:hypothetical protein